jgi:hypothetical protein
LNGGGGEIKRTGKLTITLLSTRLASVRWQQWALICLVD